jgi:hypothetical protein
MKCLLGISLVLFIFTSCIKYEDGPIISFKTKEKRLCQTWVLEKHINSLGVEGTANIELTINKDFTGTVYYNINNPQWQPGENQETITWEWLLGTYGIILNLPTIPNLANHGFSDQSQYEIRRLTSKELWIKDRGNLMEYHFKSN